jgi:hypothetical protein
VVGEDRPGRPLREEVVVEATQNTRERHELRADADLGIHLASLQAVESLDCLVESLVGGPSCVSDVDQDLGSEICHDDAIGRRTRKLLVFYPAFGTRSNWLGTARSPALRRSLTSPKAATTDQAMRVRKGLFTWSVVWLTACAPSREAMSAGQVGCQESDIEISDEHTSLGASNSWIATCHGVRYVCSQVVTGYVPSESILSGQITQVNCTAEGAGTREVAAARPTSTATAPRRHRNGAPAGAGGFRFGQNVADAKAACEGAGFAFDSVNENHARCGGLPQDPGFAASAELTLCAASVCGIALVADPSAPGKQQMNSFVSLADTLARKYGEPRQRESKLPGECRSDSSVDVCLREGRIALRQVWRWTDTSVSLTLDKPELETGPRLKITYAQSPRALRTNADAL